MKATTQARIPSAEQVRNQKATRTLVVAHFTGLFIAVATLALELTVGLGNNAFPLVYIVSMVVALAAFSTIRNANGKKDSLPDEELDEYERHIFAIWRKRAFQLFSILTVAGGIAFCAYAAFFDVPDGVSTAMAAGLYMVFTYLFAASLPIVGFAATINRDHTD